MTITYQQVEQMFLNSVYIPKNLPPAELQLIMIGMLVIGLALVMRGGLTWKLVFTAAGAYFGGYFSYNLYYYLPLTQVPVLGFVLAGALIGAAIFFFAARIGLPASSAYIAYVLLRTLTLLPFSDIIIIAAVVFIIAVILYKDLVIIIAGILGAVAIWYSLYKLGLPQLAAELISGVLFVAGVTFQYIARKRHSTVTLAQTENR